MIFYELDVRFIRDSNNDGIGDLQGLIDKFRYFQFIGVEAIIISNLLSADSESEEQSFTTINPVLGDLETFKKLVALAKRLNIKLFIELNIGYVQTKNKLFQKALANNEVIPDQNDLINFQQDKRILERDINEKTVSVKFALTNQKYYRTVEATQEIPLNWKSSAVLDEFVGVAKFWQEVGVTGFVLKNFEFLMDQTQVNPFTYDTIKALRKFYEQVSKFGVIIGRSKLMHHRQFNRFVAYKDTRIFDAALVNSPSFVGTSNGSPDVVGKFDPKKLAIELNSLGATNYSVLALASPFVGRVVSRWGSEDKYHAESAKSIAIMLLTAKGSVDLYFGDEIGTKNLGLTYLDDFLDKTISLRQRELVSASFSERNFIDAQILQNPINNRAPMAWNGEKNGGFSEAPYPIAPINSDYVRINVLGQFNDQRSILSFYRRLISLRKMPLTAKIFTTGYYEVTSNMHGLIKVRLNARAEGEIVALVNMTKKVQKLRRSVAALHKTHRVLFSSYSHQTYPKGQIPTKLEPYESLVLLRSARYSETVRALAESKNYAYDINARSEQPSKINTEEIITTREFTLKKPGEIVKKSKPLTPAEKQVLSLTDRAIIRPLYKGTNKKS